MAGVMKGVEIVPIRVTQDGNDVSVFAATAAVGLVKLDVKTRPTPTGVMSMSFGFAVTTLQVAADQPPNTIDPFVDLAANAAKYNIVPVASSGNGATDSEDLNDKTPRRNGGRNSELIVVGNCDAQGARWYQSTYLDRQSKGILSVYALGVKLQCAWKGSSELYRKETGSSPATAQVAGILALAISQGHTTAAGAKTWLLQQATRLKGVWPSDGNGSGQGNQGPPRAGIAQQVSCQVPNGQNTPAAVISISTTPAVQVFETPLSPITTAGSVSNPSLCSRVVEDPLLT